MRLSSRPPPMVSEVMVKGQSFHAVLQAFEDLRGPAYRQSVLSELPGEVGDALRGRFLLSANFYPVAWYRELFAVGAQLAPGALNFAREVGRTSGERDISGIYKVLFRALSTELVIKQSPRLFRIVYQGGKIEVLEARKGFARVSYSECWGFDRNVWQDAVGGAEACFQATGAQDLSVRIEKGGGDRDATMITQVYWR
jgi:hypothetical protein